MLSPPRCNGHGQRHPELAEVRRLVAELRFDLEPHLLKEEGVLFPAIAALAAGQSEFPFGSVAHPIHMMVIEHDRAGELLAHLRAATGGTAFLPMAAPATARCTSDWRHSSSTPTCTSTRRTTCCSPPPSTWPSTERRSPTAERPTVNVRRRGLDVADLATRQGRPCRRWRTCGSREVEDVLVERELDKPPCAGWRSIACDPPWPSRRVAAGRPAIAAAAARRRPPSKHSWSQPPVDHHYGGRGHRGTVAHHGGTVRVTLTAVTTLS